ncbi:hypothetical protein [Sorangium sp. So ce375]|uniref:hypothetical protein n=1 Tax=Sorangium sp. So ce375 TaxID=3133306 RepID=UPI003F5C785B
MLPLEKVEVLRRELAHGFDVVVSTGTSSLFPYIMRPVLEAARLGVPTIEINPEPTAVSTAVSVRLPMRAVEALEGILSRIEPGS